MKICDPTAGETIDSFAQRLVNEAANADGDLVKGVFMDVELVATADTTVETIIEWYWEKKGGDRNHGTFVVEI